MAKKNEAAEANVDYSTMNVFQKLQAARMLFLEAGAKKSGKNMHLEFQYFELADIVPIAESIFQKVGLLMAPSIEGETATAKVYNTDNVDSVSFSVPYTPIAPNRGTNEMMATGSSITYIRRYLWMVVLDIVEADTIDATAGSDTDVKTPAGAARIPTQAAKPTAKASKPVSATTRKEIKTELTAADGPADDLQLQALKSALVKLRAADSSQEEFIQKVAMETKGFTEISRMKCEALIKGITDVLANYQEA